MSKQKITYGLMTLAALIFFVLVNTSYFWEAKLGGLAFFSFLGMIAYFFVLIIILWVQVGKLITEKFNNISRLFLVVFIALILGATALFPDGIINYRKYESESLLEAYREGSANCQTHIVLRTDKSFVERNVCF